MYLLTATDITGVGGLMGSISTPTVMRRYFRSITSAKAAAETHYNGSRGPIAWIELASGALTSGDLGYIMYNIEYIEAEE